LKQEIGGFESRIDFNTEICCSNYFYINVSKHKSLYLQLTFSQNQFYIINSLQINFCQHRTKHTLSIFIYSNVTWIEPKRTKTMLH